MFMQFHKMKSSTVLLTNNFNTVNLDLSHCTELRKIVYLELLGFKVFVLYFQKMFGSQQMYPDRNPSVSLDVASKKGRQTVR